MAEFSNWEKEGHIILYCTRKLFIVKHSLTRKFSKASAMYIMQCSYTATRLHVYLSTFSNNPYTLVQTLRRLAHLWGTDYPVWGDRRAMEGRAPPHRPREQCGTLAEARYTAPPRRGRGRRTWGSRGRLGPVRGGRPGRRACRGRGMGPGCEMGRRELPNGCQAWRA